MSLRRSNFSSLLSVTARRADRVALNVLVYSGVNE